MVSFWHGFCLLLGEEMNLPINTEAMKKSMITLVIALLFAGSGVLMAQATQREYLGLPGDNLNLYAVMNLFQEAETLEAFERALNDPEQMINNLDLNGDGYVDYLMVLDYADGNVHNIVLRVALNEKDYQDVAVFVVEKLRDGAVLVQLIGDEALYGENYIIEPIYAERPNPGYTGDRGTPARAGVVTTTYYEVAAWPMVSYIYSPTYVVYRPSWRYGYYPIYWQPWRAHYYHYYYGFHYPMHTHYVTYYRPWRRPRTVVYHTTYYTNIRRHSPVVVVNIHRGSYKSTYSRPELRREGTARFEEVRAHRGTGTSVGNPGARAAASGNRSTAAPARTERQDVARQPAVRPGTAGRAGNQEVSRQPAERSGTAGRAGNQEVSRSRIEPAERGTTIQRSSNEGRNSQPAVRSTSRPEDRSSSPAVRSTSRTESPGSAPAVKSNESRSSAPAVRSSSSNNRSSSSAPAVRSSNRNESRSSTPAVRSNSRNESRSSAPAVRSNSRTESRSSTPAVRNNNRNESRSSTPAVKSSSSNNRSSSSAPAVRSSNRNESRSSTPARTQPSRTESRSNEREPAAPPRRRN